MADKARRRARILELIQRGGITSQEQLAVLLQKAGIEVTQATLSRDLRELGVAKGPSGYIPPGATPAYASGEGGLARALREFLVSGDVAGTLAVLHTGPGRAPLLALEIDRTRPKGVVGTVAGDDTVFVAVRSPREGARVVKEFRQLAGLAQEK